MEISLRQQLFFGQPFQADQEGIPGKSGKAHVGRVLIAGGAQGKDLPKGLARVGKEVDKPVSLRAQVSDPEPAGQ